MKCFKFDEGRQSRQFEFDEDDEEVVRWTNQYR
jgi:hypothetical protein